MITDNKDTMMPDPAKINILLIDDEKNVRKSFSACLEDYGYTVIEAENGKQGLDVLRKRNLDLVLVDLKMPEVDGFMVLKAIQSESPHTPVIVVSGMGIIEDVVSAVRQGAWDFIIKPLADMGILLHSVEKVLERARLIKDNKLYREHLEDEVKKRTVALEKTTEALRESEEHYRHLIENFIEGVFVHDADTTVVFVNKPGLTLFGVNEKMMLGKKAEDPFWSFYAEDGRKLTYDEYPVNRVIREKKSIVNLVVKLVRPDQSEPVWAIVNAFPEFDKNQNVKQVIETYIDITIRKNMEEDLRSLEKQIYQAQKLEAIGTLASGIAHDFNNILSSIIGYAELAIDNLPEKSPALKDLDEVMNAADRASDLVRQILAFSRHQKTEYVAVDISSIVKETMKLLRASIPSTIEIRTDIQSSGSVVYADQTQIYQIIMNLCTNAYHAMEGGLGILDVILESVFPESSHVSKCLRLKSENMYLRLTVKDNGCGMDESIRERIFDPFFTTKEKGQGTGLGLATVKNIVKELEGDIVFESTPGKGTAFYIYIPQIDEKALPVDQKISLVPMGNNEHLLLVDDEKIILGFEETMIRRLNYRVTATSKSNEALERFRADPAQFDLVITDLTMPGMTGLKLASEIHAIRKDIPVILTTGFSDGDISERFMEYGFSIFLKKPFTRKEIAEAIHQVLEG
ncbi:MAG: response regulator [Proteobacteria bacterium]|nr:response regulator [Pseudomonadota bacterium]